MDRRKFLAGTAALASGIAAPALAQAATEVSFFYPIAVGGPIAKIIDGFAADFEKANPSIKTELYNLATDPKEEKDVASEHPDVNLLDLKGGGSCDQHGVILQVV